MEDTSITAFGGAGNTGNGVKDHPLEDTFWGALFGDLTDQFGNHWLLHFDKSSKN